MINKNYICHDILPYSFHSKDSRLKCEVVNNFIDTNEPKTGPPDPNSEYCKG